MTFFAEISGSFYQTRGHLPRNFDCDLNTLAKKIIDEENESRKKIIDFDYSDKPEEWRENFFKSKMVDKVEFYTTYENLLCI